MIHLLMVFGLPQRFQSMTSMLQDFAGSFIRGWLVREVILFVAYKHLSPFKQLGS